jgi:hypothetical protein
MIRVVFVALVCISTIRRVSTAGSGRALPIDAENYVTEQFQTINPFLEWDTTNFLVDLSGHYANCKHTRRYHEITLTELTPEGHAIYAGLDHIPGTGTDVEAVNGYIINVVNEWMKHGIFFHLISRSEKFGCSVRPGCKGRVIVSCLFSNSGPRIYPPPRPPSTPRTPSTWTWRTYPVTRQTTTKDPTPNIWPGGQVALAFTREQYHLTGEGWDRSHLLENLSGFETDCAMMDGLSWPFTKAITWARAAGMRVQGIFGYAPNRGNTEEAMIVIMLKDMNKLRHARKVGCSLIPDCIKSTPRFREPMYVVISCMYED